MKMTYEEATKYIQTYFNNNNKMLQDAFQISRNIVPLLKDLHMNSVAKSLEEIIFQYDAASQEFSNTIRENGEVMVEILLGKLK